jgi:hypothetical protein
MSSARGKLVSFIAQPLDAAANRIWEGRRHGPSDEREEHGHAANATIALIVMIRIFSV